MIRMEEYARVLDYLPQGKTTGSTSQGLVQLVGELHFTLLEATVRETTFIPGKRLYVGKDKREEVQKILGRIPYNKLTSTAKDNLFPIIKKIVEDREAYFVNFINKSGSISIRVHTLDLLPGIGKKTISSLLEERNKEKFKDFEDIRSRVSGLDPATVFTHRIINELKGEEKYYLFAKPPFRPSNRRFSSFRRRRY